MSRIGSQPIKVPSGVNVDIQAKSVDVSGPKGSLTQTLTKGVSVKRDGDFIVVERLSDDKVDKARHGLIRSLLANMVHGVHEGFSKQLEVNGVGYKANLSGKNLKLALGFSHDVNYLVPEGVEVSVDGNLITVSGNDKQQVGQVAAEIRALRKPEPYKGKGIKYVDEQIIRKAGKTGAGAE